MLTVTASGVSPFHGHVPAEALALARDVAGDIPTLLAIYVDGEEVLGVLFVMRTNTDEWPVVVTHVVGVAKDLHATEGVISVCGLDLPATFLREAHSRGLYFRGDQANEKVLRFFIG